MTTRAFSIVPAAAAGSGVLLWLAAPPVGLGWLAWVALVPAAAVAVARAGSRAGRLAVPLAYGIYLELLIVPALPFGLAERQWGDPVLPIMVGDSPGVFAAVVAIPLVSALLYAIRFPQPWPRAGAAAAILVPATCWTVLDLARVKLDPSGLWGPLFLSQHDVPTARLAALAGPWPVTFAIVAVAYGIAVLAVRTRSKALAALAVPTVALVGAAAAASNTLLPGGEGALGADGVRVAVVQPGYDTAEFERPVLRYLRRRTRDDTLASRDLIGDLGKLTRTAAARGAELVVWPEATLWVEPTTNPLVRRELARLARATGVSIVAPFFLRSQSHGAAVVVTPSGRVSRAQPKQRPMWFLGENGDNRVEPEPVETPAGVVGTLLGVDNQDPASARRLAAAGADLLASSTHDWRELAPQQRAFSQLHAVAVERPLLRADWRSGSAIFDRDGRLVADAGLQQRRTVLVADVSPARSRTPYLRVGDGFAWACVAGLAALVLLRVRSRSRRS